MHDSVYICSWSRSKTAFKLWVKSEPYLHAEGSNYSEAEERLIEAIREAGGAIHIVLEFDRPLPIPARDEKYMSPELYLISGNDRFLTDAPKSGYLESAKELEERLIWTDTFYLKPICRACKSPQSPRNQKLLSLVQAPTRNNAAFGSPCSEGGATHHLVSEEFLELLSVGEKERLQFQPTLNGEKRKFFELTGPDGPPLVAVAGLNPNGWSCAACSKKVWGYWIKGMQINFFVSKEDLPNPLPGIFTVGTAPNIQLVVTASRWQKLVGLKGAKGFVSSPLGIAAGEEVICDPDLPNR